MTTSDDFLPSPPVISLRLEERTDTGPGFMKVIRSKAKFIYPDDSESEITSIDHVERRNDDAVAIVAFKNQFPDPIIYLRSSVRPALSFRDFEPSGLPEDRPGNLWEVPAGLVDAGELGVDGLLNAGARELREEVGFSIPAEKFFFLGKRTFPTVGISAERIFFVAVDVTDYVAGEPSLDGGPFEAHGKVHAIKLRVAETAVIDGYICDAKTEIAISRLKRHLGL